MYLKTKLLMTMLVYFVKAERNERGPITIYNKKGNCPAVSDVKCAPENRNECYTDFDCTGMKKCCEDQCAKFRCINPRTDEEEGRCPVEEYGICRYFEPCTSDSDCPRNEKCCKSACGGRTCKPRDQDTVEKKLFVCPVQNTCDSVDDCKGDKRCCPTDCGCNTCQRADLLAGNDVCPAQVVTLPLYDQCENDDDCPGTQRMCCANQCGVKTCTTTKKIECSNVRCADPNCGPGEVAYIPKNSCCQTCKRDCATVRCANPICKQGEVKYVSEGSCCYECKLDCSKIFCVPQRCEEGDIPIIPNGECCPKCFEDCTVKICPPIETCKPGEVKHKPEGKCCEICIPDKHVCRGGERPLANKFCAGFAGFPCPLGYICNTTLISPEVSDGFGFCCEAVCIDEFTGKGYNVGETFMRDCNTCECMVNGYISCTKKLCQPCIQGDGIVYPSGSNYKVQCNSCRCSDGREVCTRIACLGCESGYPSPDDQNCTVIDPTTCSDGYDCEVRGQLGFCCRKPICDQVLPRTFCNMDALQCPDRYYCALDGGKEGLGFCCLDCRFIDCLELICKPGYVSYQPEGECCHRCKLDCSATTCLHPTCKDGEELFTPEGECCALCKRPEDCYDQDQGVVYRNETQFKYQCNTCFCEDGFIACTEEYCGEGYCETGLKPDPDDDCEEDYICSSEDYVCEPSGLCCREPTCTNALPHTYCTLDSGCPLGYKCNLLGREEYGFCCPAEPCFVYGLRYESGESYVEQCNTCTCIDRVFGCTEKACFGCYFQDEVYEEGDAVEIDSECGECICTQREGIFEVKCPNCCVLNDRVIQKDENFKGISVCDLCSCVTGDPYAQIECFVRDCPRCEDVEPAEGECCAVCPPEE